MQVRPKMTFINREKELGALEKFWKEDDAQLIVIYGKRRIGKTELIKQFIKGKPHVYFLAQRINDKENLRLLGEAIGEYYSDDILRRTGFKEWKWFFEYTKNHIKDKTVLIFDEFPYLAEANKGISSIFQAGWDEQIRNSHVFLILCGSSIGMMENEILSQKAPLFGRRTGQIFLKPFSFSDARKFYPVLPFERCLEFFSIAGGNPSYLKRFNPKISLDRNITESILQPEAFLYDEVEFILREELREPRNYFAILRAIALGKNKFGEIVNETGLEKGVLHKYLFILEDLRLIQKDVPVTEKNPLKSRKGLYRLQDQFIRFWFRYVLPNRRNIEEGNTDYVIKRIKNDFSAVVADNYETVSQEMIKSREEKLFPFESIGRWWDRNEEIDLVAINEGERKILFGEAKWSKKPVGTDIYDDLKRKSRLVDLMRDERTEHFCLFSKSGFTNNLLKLAKKENIALFQGDRFIEP
jgi:AAA+ ATPase superfamily predicted ATPase